MRRKRFKLYAIRDVGHVFLRVKIYYHCCVRNASFLNYTRLGWVKVDFDQEILYRQNIPNKTF